LNIVKVVSLDEVAVANAKKDVVLIATGRMVTKAIEVSEKLSSHSIGSVVVDLYMIKPLNLELLYAVINGAKAVVTIEEHSIIGGVGSAISEIIAEKGFKCNFRRIGLPDEFCHQYGNRDFLHKLNKLDIETMTEIILEMLE
jgi:transketolase